MLGRCIAAGTPLSHQGLCRCHAGWRGDACEVLDLLPAVDGAGLDLLPKTSQMPRTSTWGGAVSRG